MNQRTAIIPVLVELETNTYREDNMSNSVNCDVCETSVEERDIQTDGCDILYPSRMVLITALRVCCRDWGDLDRVTGNKLNRMVGKLLQTIMDLTS